MRLAGRRRLPAPTWPGLALAVAVTGCYFLPWARSGQVERSAFELARAVQTLGFSDGLPRQTLLVGFWVTPILVAAAWTAAALGFDRLSGALVVVVAGVALASAVTVLRADAVRAGPGPVVCIVLGASTLAFGLWMIARAVPE